MKPEQYCALGTLIPHSEKLLPEHALWVSLQGGNGVYEQRRAQEEWLEQLQVHAAAAVEAQERVEWQQLRKLEMERQHRAADEELRLRNEEACAERERIAADLAREEARREEAERLRRLEEERQQLLMQPRPCERCKESGVCLTCQGHGQISRYRLAPSVPTHRRGCAADDSHGNLPQGCADCGGSGDGRWWGAFVAGSGKCADCSGYGKLKAPAGGWRDPNKPQGPEPPRRHVESVAPPVVNLHIGPTSA